MENGKWKMAWPHVVMPPTTTHGRFVMRCMTKPQQAAALLRLYDVYDVPNDDLLSVCGICTHPNPTPMHGRFVMRCMTTPQQAAALLRLYDVPNDDLLSVCGICTHHNETNYFM